MIILDFITKNTYINTLKNKTSNTLAYSYDNNKLRIVNYFKVIVLSETLIEVKGLKVEGKELAIVELDKNYLIIKGTIQCLKMA